MCIRDRRRRGHRRCRGREREEPQTLSRRLGDEPGLLQPGPLQLQGLCLRPRCGDGTLDGNGPHPAMLCVHGHWPLAKHEPTVQKRCIGLARLGFVVLAVDAFGAGERGIQPELGEYHGEMVAGTLWPTGLALAGIQVNENIPQVDKLTRDIPYPSIAREGPL